MTSRDFSITLLVLLHLWYNGNSCPTSCQCFTPTRVFCSDERLTEMPKNLSSHVRELVIMTTNVMYVRSSDFPEGSELTKLVFINNLLRGMSHLAFNRLTRLRELEISGNQRLERLGAETLSHLGNLTTLVLNANHLRALGTGFFDALQNLQTLQLKGNGLIHVSGNTFQNLSSLRHLDLSVNLISSVDRAHFVSLAKLEVLRLGFNTISSLPADAFSGTPQLRELCLQANRIAQLPNALLSSLAQLEKLNLRGNQLKELGANAFPSGLRQLNLEDNRLAVLSPSAFGHLPHLTHLFLAKNHLTVLHAELFRSLTALEHLDLSENQLTGLPKAALTGLSSLEVVRLQKNNISRLENGMFQDQEGYLEHLDLSDNALPSVPSGFLDFLWSQNVIRLHGNPWACDCDLLYLYDWLVLGGEMVQDVAKMFCRTPRSLRGQVLVSLKREQLVCTANISAPPQPTPPQVPAPEKPTSPCVIQETNGTISMECVVQKCPQIQLLTWHHNEEEDKYYSQTQQGFIQSTPCLNSTITITF